MWCMVKWSMDAFSLAKWLLHTKYLLSPYASLFAVRVNAKKFHMTDWRNGPERPVSDLLPHWTTYFIYVLIHTQCSLEGLFRRFGRGGKYRKASAGNTEYSLQQSKDVHKSPAQNKTGHVVENTGSSKDVWRGTIGKQQREKKRKCTRKKNSIGVTAHFEVKWPWPRIADLNGQLVEEGKVKVFLNIYAQLTKLRVTRTLLSRRFVKDSSPSHNGVLTNKKLD